MNMREIENRFREAYETHADAIFRFCYFRVYERERALELMQETFMRVWQSISRGTKVENLRAFLYTTARNLVIDESRKRKTTSLNTLQESGFDPPAVPQSIDVTLDAQSALKELQKLEEPYREVITLRYVEGLKPQDIARITGETSNVISVRLHRALKQLKSILYDHQ